MRLCACLWGGMFNPLIPVCRSLPGPWRSDAYIRLTGRALTQGYIQFFEPDVYVEAQPGLAVECGIKSDHGIGISSRVVTLDDFVSQEHGRGPEFTFGLSMIELYRDLYKREFRFEPKHKRRVVLFEGRSSSSTFLEAAAGAFPREGNLNFFRQSYLNAFDAEVQAPSAKNWADALRTFVATPLSFTRFGIDRQPDGMPGARVFIADPRNPLDILDLWNLRLYCGNVLPFNLDWLPGCRDVLREFIEQSYRPLPGNSHGVMMHTTLQFGRSIGRAQIEQVSKTILDGLPSGSWGLQQDYDSIWDMSVNDMMPNWNRALVEAKTQTLDLPVESKREPVVKVASLSPDFAEPFGGRDARWVNVIRFSNPTGNSEFAFTLPPTPKQLISSRLRRGHALMVSREGFVLPQSFKDHTEFFWLFDGAKAITEWLRERGIEASPSDSGRITDQVLAALGGFWGAHVLCDEATIKLLDKMSKSVRTHLEGNRTEEYPDRTAHVNTWLSLINRRNANSLSPRLEVQNFIRAGALHLGLAIQCPTCEYENWYGVGHLNQRLTCERCLRRYNFPQGTMNFGNTPWRYRVTGAFSVPNYAGGAYATVLALRCLAAGLGFGRARITYSSNLNLDIAGEKVEVDFAGWYARDHILGLDEMPWFVAGEAKSFADEAISAGDVSKLKLVGTQIPGTVLVIAVLKYELSSNEKKNISRLALWGRKRLADGRWKAPVIVLTGTELFAANGVASEWENSDGLRRDLSSPAYVRLDNLITLARLTQRIYLDLPNQGS